MLVTVKTSFATKCLLGRIMPSFAHVITGSGMPDALQWKLTFDPGEAIKAFGETATCGGTTKCRNK